MKRESIQRSPHEQKLLQRLTIQRLRSGTGAAEDYTEGIETIHEESHEHSSSQRDTR